MSDPVIKIKPEVLDIKLQDKLGVVVHDVDLSLLVAYEVGAEQEETFQKYAQKFASQLEKKLPEIKSLTISSKDLFDSSMQNVSYKIIIPEWRRRREAFETAFRNGFLNVIATDSKYKADYFKNKILMEQLGLAKNLVDEILFINRVGYSYKKLSGLSRTTMQDKATTVVNTLRTIMSGIKIDNTNLFFIDDSDNVLISASMLGYATILVDITKNAGTEAYTIAIETMKQIIARKSTAAVAGISQTQGRTFSGGAAITSGVAQAGFFTAATHPMRRAASQEVGATAQNVAAMTQMNVRQQNFVRDDEENQSSCCCPWLSRF